MVQDLSCMRCAGKPARARGRNTSKVSTQVKVDSVIIGEVEDFAEQEDTSEDESLIQEQVENEEISPQEEQKETTLKQTHLQTSDGRWQPFPYVDEASGETFHVGEWTNEFIGEERRIIVKPTKMLRIDKGQLAALNLEISRIGKGTMSENGKLVVFLSKDREYGEFLKKIGLLYRSS